MFLPGGGRAAAERQGRGPGGRVWRHGIADCIRASRIRNGSFESHHDCSSRIHADVVDASDPGDTWRRVVRKRTGKAAGAGQIRSSTTRIEVAWEHFGDSSGWPTGTGSVAGAKQRASPGATATSAQEIASFGNAEVAELADALA
jgi:hypothetical protein